LYTQQPENANLYLSQSNYVESLLKQSGNHLETLISIQECVVTSRPSSFEECVTWARFKFEELFHNSIAQLLYNFPKDSVFDLT
jgi:ubiquitin-activating enzyme E1